jgi:hypothetical protein
MGGGGKCKRKEAITRLHRIHCISGLCANRISKNVAKFDETFIKLQARPSVVAEFLSVFRLDSVALHLAVYRVV